MSDQAHIAGERTVRAKPQGPRPPQPPTAVVKKSRWPGWIWAVPIAALAIVLYLGVRSIVQGGPTVTVVFAKAPGVKADQTRVEYEGSEVGTVTGVKWHKNLKAVDVNLEMNPDMAGHLGPGTRYWIAGEHVSLTNLSNIKSIISGPHIEIEPHPGRTVSKAQGLAEPPVITTSMRGTLYIFAPKLSSVSRGSQVFYLGLNVGRVLNYTMEPSGRGFDFTVFIEQPYNAFVHTGTRFWNASAVDFSMGAAGPSVRLQSLPALLEGAIAFETPSGPQTGPLAKPDALFTLFASKNAAENAAPPQGVEYRVQFVGTAVSIPPDAPVKLLDKQIGAVRSSTVQYDPATGDLVTKAILVLNPAAIQSMPGLAVPKDATPKQRMNAILGDMVAKGLRAQLSQSPPFIGSEQVVLRFDKSAPDPPLGGGPVPEIPSETEGGGANNMQGVVNKANDVLDQASGVIAKLNRIPIAEIGREVQQTTARLAKISRSPEIARSLHRLDRSLANIEKVTNEAETQFGPIMANIRRVTDEAKQAIASARTTLASAQSMFTGRGAQYQNNPNAANIPATLYELDRAARSIRELSNLVDRKPSSIIFGKGKNE